MMKKKLNIIIIILILVIVTCALLLIRERVIYYKTIEEIKETKIPVLTESLEVTDELKKLRAEYNNNDIKGIIYIQDTLNVLFTESNNNYTVGQATRVPVVNPYDEDAWDLAYVCDGSW